MRVPRPLAPWPNPSLFSLMTVPNSLYKLSPSEPGVWTGHRATWREPLHKTVLSSLQSSPQALRLRMLLRLSSHNSTGTECQWQGRLGHTVWLCPALADVVGLESEAFPGPVFSLRSRLSWYYYTGSGPLGTSVNWDLKLPRQVESSPAPWTFIGRLRHKNEKVLAPWSESKKLWAGEMRLIRLGGLKWLHMSLLQADSTLILWHNSPQCQISIW